MTTPSVSKNFLKPLVIPESPNVDIVAVHGLNPTNAEFHAEATWTAEDKLWLKDFLPSKLPKARILLFGYNSNVAFETSIAGVREQAVNLLNRLTSKRGDAGDRPIIFVAHSLGGIIVKRALVEAKLDDSYKAIRDATYGIAFFGTPHQGGNFARLGDIAASIVRGVCRSPMNTFMEALKKDSLFSDTLVDDFRHQLEDYHVLSFYETLPMGRLGLIVDKRSATLGLAGVRERQIPMEADHNSVCKFASAEGDAYEQVSFNLVGLVTSAVAAAAERERIASSRAPSSNVLPQAASFSEEDSYLQILDPLDYNQDKDSVPDYCAGSCDWFLQHQTYSAWLKCEAPSTLWFLGPPGCGKSVLASFLVDKLKCQEADIPLTICFFFCHETPTTRPNACHILRSVLYQLLSANRSLIRYASELRSRGAKSIGEVSTLWRIFEAISEDQISGNIICLIDALDECEPRSRAQLLRYMGHFIATQQNSPHKWGHLKFVLTSRSEIAVSDDFKNNFGVHFRFLISAEDETENINNSVALAVKDRVSKIASTFGLSERRRLQLENRIISNADRTFLWVYIVLDKVEDTLNRFPLDRLDEALDEMLSTLPSKLQGLYQKFLDERPEHFQHDAERVLQIILVAFSPLTLGELKTILAIRPNDTLEADINPRFLPPTASYVKQLCGPFVRIIDSKLYLVHSTASEFLLGLYKDLYSLKNCTHLSPISQQDISSTHLCLAKCCLTYLSLVDLPTSFTKVAGQFQYSDKVRLGVFLEGYPLYAYCTKYWWKHVQASISDQELLHLLHRFLVSGKHLLRWTEIFFFLDGQQTYPPRFPPLHVLAKFNLTSVWPVFSRLLPSLTITDTYGRTVLHEAVQSGSLDLISDLFTIGAKNLVNIPDCRGVYPLHLAIRSGDDQVVRLLLDNKADFNNTTDDGISPLDEAAFCGSETIVELLLDAGAEIIDSNEGPMVLLGACVLGWLPVVRRLFERGVDIHSSSTSDGITALHMAAIGGHVDVVRYLLENNAVVDGRSNGGETALIHAVGRGRSSLQALPAFQSPSLAKWLLEGQNEAVVKLLLQWHADPNKFSETGGGPLHRAAEHGYTSIVALLLNTGVNPNLPTEEGCTPLHFAALGGFRSIIELLISRGAGINESTMDRIYPLHCAVSNGSPESVELLLEKGADPNLVTDDGLSPLHKAIEQASERNVELLLGRRACVQSRTKEGISPCLLASRLASNTLLDKLLSKGADPTVASEDGTTPLHVAVAAGSISCVNLLLDKRVNINAKGNHGKCPIHLATNPGSENLLAALIKSGADTSVTTDDGRTALHLASWNGAVHEVRLLINASRREVVASSDKGGSTPLHCAASSGSVATASILLDAGADVNSKCEMEDTPLHSASIGGSGDVVHTLVRHGACVNAKSANLDTPLHRAAYWSAGWVLQVLISYGADINVKNKAGATPLHDATKRELWMDGAEAMAIDLVEGRGSQIWGPKRDATTIIDQLLDAGADIEARMEKGMTPLISAAQYGDCWTVEKLLRRGANVNACSTEFVSPLHAAALKGSEECVRLLLFGGADPMVHNSHGTPLNWAYSSKSNSRSSITRLLRQAMFARSGEYPNY